MRRHLHFPEFLDARLRSLMKQHAHTRWKACSLSHPSILATWHVTLVQALVQDMSDALQQQGRCNPLPCEKNTYVT
jgi:hypothetical protein